MGSFLGGSRAVEEVSEAITEEAAAVEENKKLYKTFASKWDFVDQTRVDAGQGQSSGWNVVHDAKPAGKAYFLVSH